MNIVEYRITLAETQATLLRTRANDCLLSALDLLALVKLRIQRKGENSEGNKFSPYTKPYAKFRKDRGAQTEYKDYNVTGRLSANITPLIESDTPQETVVSIGARSDDNRAKLAGATKKDGNILTPSKSEIALLQKVYAQRRIKRLNKL
jgi:hypothetical protein